MSQITKNFSNSGPGGFVQTLTGDTGGAVLPAAGNINVVGGGIGTHGIHTTGNLAANTLTIQINNTITLGDLAIVTAGNPSVTLQSGDLTISGTGANAAGNINMPNTTSDSRQGIYNMGGNRFIHNEGAANCTFVGSLAGNPTDTVQSTNTGIGTRVLQSTITPALGGFNTGVGGICLFSCTTGIRNTGLGANSLERLTIGNDNTALGNTSLQRLISGSFNTAIGGSNTISAGPLNQLTTGSNNIAIGSWTGAAASGPGYNYTGAESNNIVVGGATMGTLGESNTMRLGTSGSGNGQVNRCFVGGINGVNVGSVASVVSISGDQLGSTTITAGTNISVTPGANTITIAGTGAASFGWSVISANQTAAVNNGYFCNKGSTLALALPATSAVGDVIEVSNINTALGVQFTQAAGQQIFIGTTNTTLGATGTLTSSAVGDALKIVCRVANTTWQVTSGWGNWTPA